MKRVLSVILIAMLSISLVACSGKTGNQKSDKELTVYLNDFDGIIGEMFEEKTGIKINIVAGNGAETMSRIAAERNNPQWDVVWADMMPSIHSLMEEGALLTGWMPENGKELTEFATGIIPEEKGYFPTGAHAAGVLVYRTDVFDENTAPKDIFDLANDQYKVGMADPGVAAPAYPLAAYFMNKLGLEEGKKYFEDLFDHGLKVYPKNPQVVQALASGEINVALLQESNAYNMIQNGEPVKIVWPENGAPASVRVAAISSKTDKEELAKEFVNFLLSPEVQQKLVELGDEGLYEPSAKNVNMKEERKADNATLDYANAKWSADHEGEIKAWFADMSAQ